MGCVGWFLNSHWPESRDSFQFIEHARALQIDARRSMVGIDRLAPSLSVTFIDQLRHWDLCEVGIAEKLRAIVKGPAKSFHHQVNRLRGAIAEFGEVKPLQNIKYLN